MHGARVQFRPVRFGPSSSVGHTLKDRDIETIWCSDSDRPKERFDGDHASLKVEHARPVGEVPVLFVSDGTDEADRRPYVSAPHGRVRGRRKTSDRSRGICPCSRPVFSRREAKSMQFRLEHSFPASVGPGT